MKTYYVYILQCADLGYYTGVTNNLSKRISEHQDGSDRNSYIYHRRPVKLIFSQIYTDINQAIALEKQIKGWSRKKKEAFIKEEWENLKAFSKSYSKK